jgi:hypothetical protein
MSFNGPTRCNVGRDRPFLESEMTPQALVTPVRRPTRSEQPACTGGRATASARRGGGPQDRALYTCGCGHAFKASVSTSVGCPRCGTAQAW